MPLAGEAHCATQSLANARTHKSERSPESPSGATPVHDSAQDLDVLAWSGVTYRNTICWSRIEGVIMGKSRTDAFLPLRETLFQTLLSLSSGDLHGYAVKQEVEERTRGLVKMGPGTLYETLQRAEKRGLIEETEQPSGDDHSQRRYYRLTRLGRSVLEAEVLRLEEMVEEARSRGLGGARSRA